jgi:hypothetical protein
VSSRLEDLRDLAVMLDQGKITQQEYDVVKAELIDAPADEWDEPTTVPQGEEPVPGTEPEPPAGWRGLLVGIPPLYRAAAAGAMLVLVAGVVLAASGDTAGSVRADRSGTVAATAGPTADSLGVMLSDLTARWNEVGDPPSINGGIMTAPEPGRFDSFVYRFEGTAVLAGAYDPADGSVHALLARASLLDEAAGSLFIHLCHLLKPGSQACLDEFVQATGTFGIPHSDLAGTETTLSWELEGQTWEVEIAEDVETIRVRTAD